MTRLKTVAALLSASLATLAASTAQADAYLSAARTSEDTVALQIELDRQFALTPHHPEFTLRLGGGLLWLPGDDGRDNAALTLTPAFRYTFGEQGARPFVEAGVGVALFKETRLESQRLSTAFQFEDRLAVGWIFPGFGEIGLSATHYSNANIDTPNDGFETYGLSYRVPL